MSSHNTGPVEGHLGLDGWLVVLRDPHSQSAKCCGCAVDRGLQGENSCTTSRPRLGLLWSQFGEKWRYDMIISAQSPNPFSPLGTFQCLRLGFLPYVI